MLETLVEVWTEELVKGGRIEIEHFLVIDVQTMERAANRLLPKRRFRKITARTSWALRKRLNHEANLVIVSGNSEHSDEARRKDSNQL